MHYKFYKYKINYFKLFSKKMIEKQTINNHIHRQALYLQYLTFRIGITPNNL